MATRLPPQTVQCPMPAGPPRVRWGGPGSALRASLAGILLFDSEWDALQQAVAVPELHAI